MEKSIRVMGVTLRIQSKPRQYSSIFSHPGGRLERRLKDERGRLIPSPDAKVVNGDQIHGEPPEMVARVWTAVAIMSNRLSDEGAFSKNNMLFSDAMDKYLEWRSGRRSPTAHKQRVFAARQSIIHFGDLRLSKIDRRKVREWIDELAEKYRGTAVQNYVSVPRAMFSWLKKEGMFQGENPFQGHEWRVKASLSEVKPLISQEEFHLAMTLAESPRLKQALMMGYYTGLRPTEIYRIKQSDFDHKNLILVVREEKTRSGIRYIAIPQVLSTWIINNELFELKDKTIQRYINNLAKTHPSLSGITMETFRKNYASALEQEGVQHEWIDAHQGRFQNTVIQKHYLRDKYRAVKLIRPFIHKIWDGQEKSIRLVTAEFCGETVAKTISEMKTPLK